MPSPRRTDYWKQRIALGIITAATLLPVSLSLFAEPIRYVTAVAIASGMVTLLTGIAWLYPERMQNNLLRLRQKQHILAACLALIASVPLTHWPLRIGFAVSRPAMTKTILQADWQSKVAKEEFISSIIGDGKTVCITGLQAMRAEFPHRRIEKRAGLFNISYYKTDDDGSILLYLPYRKYCHPAFRYRPTEVGGFSTVSAVNLGGGWKFVDYP
jgi:hypothetical protein